NIAVCKKRSTNIAPDFLSSSYFTGTPPTGISMIACRSDGGFGPALILLTSIVCSRWKCSNSICGAPSDSIRLFAIHVSTRIGIDIGGTFTDLVVLNEATGEVSNAKMLTTPQDLTQGVVQCLREAGVDLQNARIIVHGTTVGINAILEHKGART